MLSIPLKYTYLTKPSTIINDDKNQRVLYETSTADTSQSIWREVDTRDSSTQFKDTLVNGVQFTDNLPSLRTVTKDITREGLVKATLIEDRILENTLTINLSGPSHAISTERARILRSYHQVERRHIGLAESSIFTSSKDSEEPTIERSPEVKIEDIDDTSSDEKPHVLSRALCQYLDDIADYCGVSIFVTDFIDKIPYGIGYHAELVSESANMPYHILIYGDQDSARFAEFKTKVILEELAGNFVDSLSMELSLQPLVAGPNLANLKYIMLQTKTKIFTPDWLPELFSSQCENPNARNLNEVYITGQEFQVLIAKVLLRDIVRKTTTLVKDCVISFAKIDLLTLRFQDQLRKIMESEGSFVQIPYLGAARAVIRVQCTNIQTCSQTISQLMKLTSQLYSATYWVHTGQDDGAGNLIQPDIKVDFELLDKISAASGATITCKNTSFAIIGFKSDTKRAVSMINSLYVWEVSDTYPSHYYANILGCPKTSEIPHRTIKRAKGFHCRKKKWQDYSHYEYVFCVHQAITF